MAVQIVAGYWNLDLGSRELLLCPKSRQMFGIDGGSPEKLGKRDWLPRIHPDDIPLIEGELDIAGRRNEIYAARFRAVRPDGSLCQVLGVGRRAATDKSRFVGLNFDLAATAESADFEFRGPAGTIARYLKSVTVNRDPANENQIQRPPEFRLREKPWRRGERSKEETGRQMEPVLDTMEAEQLRQKFHNLTMLGDPAFGLVLALYVTRATRGLMDELRKSHAARIDTIHEGLGQHLTAISLAVGALDAGGEAAGAAARISMAVEEARHELNSHRYEASMEGLP